MIRVSVERTLPTPPDEVTQYLSPEGIVRLEGHYDPKSVRVDGDRTVVTVSPTGRMFAPQYEFIRTRDGFSYRVVTESRSPVEVETTVTLAPRDGTTGLRIESSCRSIVPFLDRVLAWRRRRTLERLARNVTEAVPDDGANR
ncbi:SRPBCC family protein [Candidatus Halobonum tyrrellensis]|uniref:SRPBCC family protein n=1 Tax=Candidatus Halobonum tyrrellensis TaxID=1431545 RepID=UPI0012680A14|nr:SRPBCC family protein [Candidatus Halobonum tyrrellensis]